MKKILTIGGSDPTAGAGVQIDLKVFNALGCYGISVITSITSQNTYEFSSVYPLPEEVLIEQFETLLKDIKPHGAKTGMLYTEQAVKCVAKYIKKYKIKNLVIDPVITSTTGTKLLLDEALQILKTELIPLSKAITANIPEAEILTGIKIKKLDDMYKSAEALFHMGTKLAIIKGGHFNNKVPDLLFDGKEFFLVEGEKIEGQFHGTGCAFSSAFVSFLCKGYKPDEALKESKKFVSELIRKSLKIGKGMKILNLF